MNKKHPLHPGLRYISASGILRKVKKSMPKVCNVGGAGEMGRQRDPQEAYGT